MLQEHCCPNYKTTLHPLLSTYNTYQKHFITWRILRYADNKLTSGYVKLLNCLPVEKTQGSFISNAESSFQTIINIILLVIAFPFGIRPTRC
jgi:hypothetical protein